MTGLAWWAPAGKVLSGEVMDREPGQGPGGEQLHGAGRVDRSARVIGVRGADSVGVSPSAWPGDAGSSRGEPPAPVASELEAFRPPMLVGLEQFELVEHRCGPGGQSSL